MMKAYPVCAIFLLACAASAEAADNAYGVSTKYTGFSNAFGNRRETSAESTTDLGPTTIVANLAQARRKFGEESYSAVRLSGTVYHDWSDRLYTRTSIAVSSNTPVYATRELAQDINYKLLPGAVVTLGAKQSRYFGRRDAFSWSAGGTYYFSGGLVTYRYSGFDVETLGKSHGHTATIRIKDGKGAAYTQLWAGAGTSLHEQELLFATRHGSYRTIALQRLQPIKGSLAVTATLGRAWYDTDVANYRGTTASIGLSLRGRGPF